MYRNRRLCLLSVNITYTSLLFCYDRSNLPYSHSTEITLGFCALSWHLSYVQVPIYSETSLKDHLNIKTISILRPLCLVPKVCLLKTMSNLFRIRTASIFRIKTTYFGPIWPKNLKIKTTWWIKDLKVVPNRGGASMSTLSKCYVIC